MRFQMDELARVMRVKDCVKCALYVQIFAVHRIL